jgi:hypothetical protein
MYRGAELVEVLRLLVLLSAVGGGLPRRQLDSLRMEVVHTYGHQHLLTLNALEQSGRGCTGKWAAAGCRVAARSRYRDEAAGRA